ncbi:MAG: hypothetical protein LBR37_03355, partial [Erysipelotrichaceae bacterium]|nr:hypothetical protein [Erysipelotrichaceae bacterium]
MKKTTKISIILLVAASITVSGILIFDPNINKNGNVFSHAVVDEDNCPLPLGHTPIKELVTKNYVDQSVIFRGAVTRILGDNNDGNFYFYVQDGAYAIECFSQEAASFAINDVVDVAGVIDKLYSYVACTTTSVSVVETTTPKVIIPYEVTTFSDFEALTLIDSGRLVTVKDMIFVSDNRDANRNGEIEFSLENNDLFVTVYSSFL